MTSTAVSGQAFRPDIDGLRTIAIVLVVAFHAHVPGFGGGFIGVDVFFVISGYLISRNLLAESASGQPVRLLDFWAKRIRRLVPALALMVIATLALSALILSPFEWTDLPREAGAAALYVSNILFATAETSYFDVRGGESPFLHTWSLGVEEQFYVVWPLLFLAVAWLVRRPDGRKRTLLCLFGAGATVSFALSLWLTQRGSPWAFYSLPTRAWEFAAAGLLAGIVVPAALRGRRAQVAGYATGFILLGAATLAFRGDQPYPGLRAVVPVAATLLLLVAGESSDSPPSPLHRALAARPMQWVGRVSYSWYLWHWPAMILAVAWLDRDSTPIRVTAGLLALPIAGAAHHWVENPLRFSAWLTTSRARTVAMGAGVTLLVVVAAVGFARYSDRALTSDRYAELVATKDAHRGLDCAVDERSPSGIDYCLDGDLGASRTIMLIGDSHARQWMAAFADGAESADARLAVRWKSVCPSLPVRVTSFEGIESADCAAFRTETLRLVEELRPDVVVVANYSGYRDQILTGDGSDADRAEQAEIWADGFAEHLEGLQGSGARIGVVVDNPRLETDPLVCLSRRGNTEEECQPTRSAALAATAPFQSAEADVMERIGGITTFGVTDRICDSDRCDLIQGSDFVFVDRDHLSVAWTMGQDALIANFFSDLFDTR